MLIYPQQTFPKGPSTLGTWDFGNNKYSIQILGKYLIIGYLGVFRTFPTESARLDLRAVKLQRSPGKLKGLGFRV